MPPAPSPPDTSPNAAPLSQALVNIANAATNRANEGQQIFGPIASLWDDYLNTEAVRILPARLRKPLIALCADISATANKHFDAYIKGTHPPRPSQPSPEPLVARTHQPKAAKPTQHLADSAFAQKETYAHKAAVLPTLQPTATIAPTAAKTARKQPQHYNKEDTRLFVRIGPEHPARTAGSFAVLTALKRRLGENAKLLKEVQAVKTGFALCTGSLAERTALEKHSDTIEALIQNCKIEPPQHWTTYRLNYVPRTVATIDDTNQPTNIPVSSDLILEAINDFTNQQAIQAVESSQSVKSGHYDTTWFLSFPTHQHTALPKNLRILGTTVTASLIVLKPKITQCSRCFRWHNTRACSRPERCRICGTTEHTEEGHSTKCNTAHTCPARCLHCGGPYPADDPRCPLRLTHRGPKSKSEQQAIRKTSKEARVRACAKAQCSRAPRADTQMGETTILQPLSPCPTTAICATPTRAPSTPTRTPLAAPRPPNSSNRFITLEAASLPIHFNV